jgi:hypothetical protein
MCKLAQYHSIGTGLRVYNDKLQINFEIHSGWMIFGQLTAVGLWNLAKYLVVTTFVHYDLRYWLDLIKTNYCLRSVSSSLLKFTRCIQGNNIASTNLDMTRNLQYLHMNKKSYTYKTWSVTHHCNFKYQISSQYLDIDLIFGMWVHSDELPIKFEFRSNWMILG